MMPELASIYDAAFFAEWGRTNDAYVRSARIVADAILAEFAPKSLVDLGCGCGVYSHYFAEKGARVRSIDGVAAPEPHAFPMDVRVADLTEPILGERSDYDLTLCLEVAEHIPEPLVDAFLDNLVRFSPRVLLSAAPPHQGGHHHVNEQPKRYWVEKMARRGWVYRRPETGRLMTRLMETRPPLMWMAQHISLYERPSGDFPRRQDMPFSTRLSSPPDSK
jgi:hypothetical protein